VTEYVTLAKIARGNYGIPRQVGDREDVELKSGGVQRCNREQRHNKTHDSPSLVDV
jgi:hypothetical protein